MLFNGKNAIFVIINTDSMKEGIKEGIEKIKAIFEADPTIESAFRKAVRSIRRAGQSLSEEVSDAQKELISLGLEKRSLKEKNETLATEIEANKKRIEEINARQQDLAKIIKDKDDELREALTELERIDQEIPDRTK